HHALRLSNGAALFQLSLWSQNRGPFQLGRDHPSQRGLCRLLSGLVGSYVEAFDEAPLPVEIADGAYRRLLALVASIDLNADADRRLADINRVAESRLWQ
ncbi:hypothetical protein, partial [Bradyrhizobium diazoefficiens]|uniref:hypothetical protein n=1 Tax=Bradyrhizobium diazoefficiens TaxID=1355477 RepID=UPI00201247FE